MAVGAEIVLLCVVANIYIYMLRIGVQETQDGYGWDFFLQKRGSNGACNE